MRRWVLRLTLLALDIVEAILDGRQPAELQLDVLLEKFPLEWAVKEGSSSPMSTLDVFASTPSGVPVQPVDVARNPALRAGAKSRSI